jgi:mRNA interferase RelE/StbE
VSAYSLYIEPQTVNELTNLDGNTFKQVVKKILWLAQNARDLKHEAIQGDEWRDKYKWRVGNYRIIYELDQNKAILTIIRVGHRSTVYNIPPPS